jgi:hypothetical protein
VLGTSKGTSCKGVLCDPGLGPVVAESQHWNLVLNKRIQNALEGGAREADGPRDQTGST